MAPKSDSLFAWPSNPSLTTFHLLTRVVLLITNAVGLSVSFAAGANSSTASFWVSGSFMSASIIFFQPIFIAWNARQLRRNTRRPKSSHNASGYQQLESGEGPAPRSTSTLVLRYAILVDIVGVLGYWITWGFNIKESLDSGWDYYTHGMVALMTYAGVATLVCAISHTILLTTQLRQLHNAHSTAKLACMKTCPHCHLSLNTLPEEQVGSEASRSSSGRNPQKAQQTEQNLLGQEDETPHAYNENTDGVDMAPGQVTGICPITPRVSSAGGRPRADSSTTANEIGMGEGDRLIEKRE